MANSPSLKSEYTRITGQPWAHLPETRKGQYEVMAAFVHRDDFKFRSFIDNMMTLFRWEESAGAKDGVLEAMSGALHRRQKNEAGQKEYKFYSLYEQLGAAMKDKRNAGNMKSLVGVALDVATNEYNAPCELFFKPAVHFVADYITKLQNPDAKCLKYVEARMSQICRLGATHPDMVTPRYVEACIAALKIPISDSKAPKMVREIHRLSANGLLNLIEELGHPHLKYGADVLFFEKRMQTLYKFAATSPDRSVCRHISDVCEALDNREMPQAPKAEGPSLPAVHRMISEIIAAQRAKPHGPHGPH